MSSMRRRFGRDRSKRYRAVSANEHWKKVGPT
jgi:hypothetical protein